ncbi:hypothetical protein [Limnohabitans sp.]
MLDAIAINGNKGHIKLPVGLQFDGKSSLVNVTSKLMVVRRHGGTNVKGIQNGDVLLDFGSFNHGGDGGVGLRNGRNAGFDGVGHAVAVGDLKVWFSLMITACALNCKARCRGEGDFVYGSIHAKGCQTIERTVEFVNQLADVGRNRLIVCNNVTVHCFSVVAGWKVPVGHDLLDNAHITNFYIDGVTCVARVVTALPSSTSSTVMV